MIGSFCCEYVSSISTRARKDNPNLNARSSGSFYFRKQPILRNALQCSSGKLFTDLKLGTIHK